MANARDKEALLRQNLADAGCDGRLTEACVRCFQQGRLSEMLPELTAHRKTVLNSVREKQKQIDCLDYLTDKIKKEKPL